MEWAREAVLEQLAKQNGGIRPSSSRSDEEWLVAAIWRLGGQRMELQHYLYVGEKRGWPSAAI